MCSAFSRSWSKLSKWSAVPAASLRDGSWIDGLQELPRHMNKLFSRAAKAERKDLAKRELAKQKRQARTELHLANWW